jgi:hypothetical protein
MFTVINYSLPEPAKEAKLVIRDLYKGNENKRTLKMVVIKLLI